MNETRKTPDGPRDVRPPFTRVTIGRRTLGAVAIAAVLVGAAALWMWRRSASSPPTSNGGSAPATRGEMAGMRGMGTSDGTVRLTTDQMRQFGVTFGSVEQRTPETSVRTVGTVTVDETKLTQVTPRFGGFVERLYADQTGQRIRQGEPLMDVYSPELVAAQQELLVATNLQRSIGQSTVPGVPASSTDLVASAKRRLELWGIAESQIDEIMLAGEARRTLTLYAPASGVVLEKNVVRGQAIQPGQMLYTIADLGVVWVDVALREADAGAVRAGSGADVELAALPGRPFKGRVTYVYPTIDTAARTIRARVEITNTNDLLKPGMYATVALRSPSRSALTVPTSAVVRTGDRTVVFMDMGQGQQGRELMPMQVEVGRTAGEYTEVLSGLESGQRVVTSAQFLLDSESNLGEVMKSMVGQMGAQDVGAMKDMPGMDMRGADVKGALKDTGKRATDTTRMPPGMKMPPARR